MVGQLNVEFMQRLELVICDVIHGLHSVLEYNPIHFLVNKRDFWFSYMLHTSSAVSFIPFCGYFTVDIINTSHMMVDF